MALVTGIISIPMTFFTSNDAFYFGVLPILRRRRLITWTSIYGNFPLLSHNIENIQPQKKSKLFFMPPKRNRLVLQHHSAGNGARLAGRPALASVQSPGCILPALGWSCQGRTGRTLCEDDLESGAGGPDHARGRRADTGIPLVKPGVPSLTLKSNWKLS